MVFAEDNFEYILGFIQFNLKYKVSIDLFNEFQWLKEHI